MILFVFTMIAVSFLNGDFFYYPQKVAADLFRIFFTALLAWQEVQRKNTDVKENEVKIWKYLVILMIIGVLLVFVGGDNYGRFPVSLHPNRAYRGEVTFWNTINHMDILLALSFVLYEYKKKIYFLFPAIFNAGFMYLAWHRTEFIVSITPFVLYAIFRDRNQTRRIILLSCCIPFIPIVFLVMQRFLVYGFNIKEFTWDLKFLDYISTYRASLWVHYIKGFIKYPLTGTGYYYILKDTYTGKAKSEISLLRWFTEHGILVGGFLLVVMLASFMKAFKFFRKEKGGDRFSLILAYIYLMNFLPSIIQSNGNIGTFSSFLYWYAMFYFFYYKPIGSRTKINFEVKRE